MDEFLATNDLVSVDIFRKGESKSSVRPGVYELSGFVVNVLGSHFDDIDEQIKEAVAYLREHQDALEQLDRREDVDEKGLDFGVRWKSAYTQTDALPSELVRLAGRFGLGLAISHYPMGERHPQAEVKSPLTM